MTHAEQTDARIAEITEPLGITPSTVAIARVALIARELAAKLDAIYAMSPLVAVPDGKPCEWREYEAVTDCGMFLSWGQLCYADPAKPYGVICLDTDAESEIDADDTVQPVRLVPLAEAEIDP